MNNVLICTPVMLAARAYGDNAEGQISFSRQDIREAFEAGEKHVQRPIEDKTYSREEIRTICRKAYDEGLSMGAAPSHMQNQLFWEWFDLNY